jgi:two-component system, chemotaxis family, CheB/CheR fusion protein
MTPIKADKDFEGLLAYLNQSRGFDFAGYKRPILLRRFKNRMQRLHIKTFDEYKDQLEVHPEEFGRLFNSILINVTSFFRDPPAWAYLSERIIPRIVESKKPRDSIRIWDAGCATGEETYSLAMVFAEVLGEKGFMERVKIYASDLDNEAVAAARKGSYSDKVLEPLSKQRKERFFEEKNHRLVFRYDLRRSVIFGNLDLVNDAPIPTVDLLVCRNTLMFLNAETQDRIVAKFRFALNPHGFLFLGKAELLLAHADLFSPVDLKFHIFEKASPSDQRGYLTFTTNRNSATTAGPQDRETRLRDVAFEAADEARCVVDAEGRLIIVTQRAQKLFGLAPQDKGRLFQDLGISYRPIDLRSLIDQAYDEHRRISVSNVEHRVSADAVELFDVSVTPLYDSTGSALGTSISFSDVTQYRRLQEEVEESRRKLEAAYEELQSTNEELETTNEELQSTNEELETTNEELQSTNEELETLNEEIRATNGELQGMNVELQQHAVEMETTNVFLRSILSSARDGIVVLDRDFKINLWNRKADQICGARFKDLKNKSFFDLDIGVPTEKFKALIRASMSKRFKTQKVTLRSTNRRGKVFSGRVVLHRCGGADDKIKGVVLRFEESRE